MNGTKSNVVNETSSENAGRGKNRSDDLAECEMKLNVVNDVRRE